MQSFIWFYLFCVGGPWGPLAQSPDAEAAATAQRTRRTPSSEALSLIFILSSSFLSSFQSIASRYPPDNILLIALARSLSF